MLTNNLFAHDYSCSCSYILQLSCATLIVGYIYNITFTALTHILAAALIRTILKLGGSISHDQQQYNARDAINLHSQL